jgi:hypothetical protein
MKVKIKINESGVRQLDKWCNEFLERLAQDVRERAIVNAPVKTGKLRDSIDILDRDMENKTILVGTQDTGYGLYVEVGHSTRDGGFVAPSGFLRRAADDAINESSV